MALLETPGMHVGKSLNLPMLKFSALCLSYFRVLWGAGMLCVKMQLDKNSTFLRHVVKMYSLIK